MPRCLCLVASPVTYYVSTCHLLCTHMSQSMYPPVTIYVSTCHSLCIHLSLTMYPPVTYYVLTCHCLCIRLSLTMYSPVTYVCFLMYVGSYPCAALASDGNDQRYFRHDHRGGHAPIGRRRTPPQHSSVPCCTCCAAVCSESFWWNDRNQEGPLTFQLQISLINHMQCH